MKVAGITWVCWGHLGSSGSLNPQDPNPNPNPNPTLTLTSTLTLTLTPNPNATLLHTLGHDSCGGDRVHTTC
jgi:hypothetical protein